MPRSARIAFDGAFYHVFNRGVNKQAIFFADHDYQHFLNKLRALKTEKLFDHEIYSYVLMPNHFHLLVQTKKTSISHLMRSLMTSYSMYLNKTYDRTGPVFQNRFKSKLCDRESYFLGVSRYIFLNPVAAGLVSSPQAYPWSGYTEAIGKTPLSMLTPDVNRLVGESDKQRRSYERFVMDGIANFTLVDQEYTLDTNRDIGGSALFQSLTQKKYLRRRSKKTFRL